MALFEGYERRIEQIKPVLAKYGLTSLEDAPNYVRIVGWIFTQS